MRYLVYIYILWALYKCYTWVYAYFANRRKQRSISKDEIQNGTKLPNLYILLPALREQALVKSTIQYFNNYKYPCEKLQIVIITTQKEEKEKKEKELLLNEAVEKYKNKEGYGLEGKFSQSFIDKIEPILNSKISNENKRNAILEIYRKEASTSQKVEEEIKNYDSKKIKHIHYPFISGGKPEQLNYGIRELEIAEDAYIAIYDFDARPDIRTGIELQQLFNQRANTKAPFPDMIQQIQIPYLNLSDFPDTIKGQMLRSNAILYIKRALGIEYYKCKKMNHIFWKKRSSLFNILDRPVTYGVGSGLYVYHKTLKEIDGFPSPMEDLSTGYRISMLDREMLPLNYFNMMLPYENYASMTNAGSISFRGAIRIYKDYKLMLKKKSRLSQKECFALVCKEFIESVLWMLEPLLTLFLYILLIAVKRIDFLLLLIIVDIYRNILEPIIMECIVTQICRDYQGIKTKCNKVTKKGVLTLTLFCPIQNFIKMISPLKAFVYWYKKYIKKEIVIQTKTER